MPQSFEKVLGEWKEDQVREREEQLRRCVPPPKPAVVELSEPQKEALVDYCLCYSKGFLEDEGHIFCPDGLEPDWRTVSHACEEFLGKAKRFLAAAIKEGKL